MSISWARRPACISSFALPPSRHALPRHGSRPRLGDALPEHRRLLLLWQGLLA